MLLPGIRRLALADLDNDMLRYLVEHGEDLLVERKRDLPDPPKFGAAAASFANTLGGWILLGVSDDKQLYGYTKPAQLDLQSHLAAVLRKECDPLPPFVADVIEIDGKSIAVLRVFESIDSPHIVRGTGAVYVRSSKGKEPVDDHGTLLELARRGREAERQARARLGNPPLIQLMLAPPDVDPSQIGRSQDPDHIRVYVRAAPMTVTPQFTDWPISGSGGADACFVAAEELLPSESGHARVQPAARGAVARKKVRRHTYVNQPWSVITAADSGGVVAASLARPADEFHERVLETHDLRRDMIRPALQATVTMLTTAEAYGRTALDVWACLPGDVRVHGGNVPPRPAALAHEIHMAGELTIPADSDEVRGLGLQWEREFARNFGIDRWEGETG